MWMSQFDNTSLCTSAKINGGCQNILDLLQDIYHLNVVFLRFI